MDLGWIWRYYHRKTCLLWQPVPGVFLPNSSLLGQIHACRTQHRGGSSPASAACVRRLGRRLRKVHKLSKRGTAAVVVVDCGAALDRLVVEADVVFPWDGGGTPPVEQLLAEAAKVLDLVQRGNSVLVVVNNSRHAVAIASLVARRANGLVEFSHHVGKLRERLNMAVDDVQQASRDLQVLQTAFRLQQLPQQEASKGEIYLESIRLVPALSIATTSYLLLMDESNGLVVHSGNAVRTEEEEEVFPVNRSVQGGLWITVRSAFGKAEVLRVFLHTGLCSAESTVEFALQDVLLTQQLRPLSQKPLSFALEDAELFVAEEAVTVVPPEFRVMVRFTLPPPLPEDDGESEGDWEEAERQAGESLLLSSDEVLARRLQLEGDTAVEDEILAWSLQFEEELSFAGGGGGSGSGRRTGADHQRMMAQLPISTFSASGGQTAAGGSNACLVCQYAFQPGDSVRTLPCFHHFHPACCDPWFLQKATCPLCQTSLSAALSDNKNEEEEE